jgi:UDP-N-acetylglucosamine 2-epimerase (hydrolysing)
VADRAAQQRRKIVFLSGTRADFGKIKSLIRTLLADPPHFEVHIFATGMHMDPKYGFTVREFEKCNFPNVYRFINHSAGDSMDQALGSTILGFGQDLRLIEPDLVVVHGDRCEALAGAIVGSLNNVLVAHIEGGELSGTVDGLIRHSVSKICPVWTRCERIMKSASRTMVSWHSIRSRPASVRCARRCES